MRPDAPKPQANRMMLTRTRNLAAVLSLGLWATTSTSCDPGPVADSGAEEASVHSNVSVDPDGPIWSDDADVFDDFERADGESLGATPIGGYSWTTTAGPRPVLSGHGLRHDADEGIATTATLGGLEVDDFLLSVLVRVPRGEAVWSVMYRGAEGAAYRLEGAGSTLSLYRGEARVGQAPAELTSNTWTRLQLIVDGSLHRVVLGGVDVMEIEDTEGPASGEFGLRGAAGAEFDDLWILATEPAGDTTGGTGGGGAGGGGAGGGAGGPGALGRQEPGGGGGGASPGPGGGSNGFANLAPGFGGGGGGGGGAEPGEQVDEPFRAVTAPTQDLTVPTTLYKQVSFLFEGVGAEQQGADLNMLVPSRIALVHGWVRDEWGQPVDGAQVWALGHPEFGDTLTRADGSYDLVVTGGVPHSVVVADDGYLSAQRQVVTKAGGSYRADDIVLVSLDPEATPILFTDPIESHHAFTLNDGAPDRMATVMFRQGTVATMVFDDETTEVLPTMTVRLTEFTVGDQGPLRMPSPLPSGTAYNYAIEISADEAEDQGAVSVELDTPAALYVDNFLGWPVGATVPSGTFDRMAGRWVPEPDGRVVEITGIVGGLAELDLTGLGPATVQELTDFGITADERAELASIHAVGAQLWRVSVAHFTPYDLNPSGTVNGEPPPDGFAPDEDGRTPDGCKGGGSIIDFDNQELGESLPVAGTPFSLEYRSSRTRGAPNRGLRIKVTGDEIPDNLMGAFVLVEVAGKQIIGGALPLPNQYAEVQWDGLDSFERPVQGPQPILLCVGWNFPDPMLSAVVEAGTGGGGGGGGGGTPALAPSFGNYPPEAYQVHVSGNPFSGAQTYLKCYGNGKSTAAAEPGAITDADKFRLGGVDAQTLSDGLGGWTLSVHHTLARASSTLYLGDGRERELADEAQWTASRFAGNRVTGSGFLEGVALGLLFNGARGLAADREGNIFVATPGLIRRIGLDGNATIVAGLPAASGPPYVPSNPSQTGYAGDGGLATEALLADTIYALAVDSTGGIYLAEGIANPRVRYINQDGVIDTIAGNGTNDPGLVYAGVTPTGGDPLQVSLAGLTDIALTPDEDGLLISQSGGFVRLLTLDGELIHIAGDEAPSFIDPAAERPSLVPCPVPDVCAAPWPLQGQLPWDTIPGLAPYLQPHEHRAEWAVFVDPLRSVTADRQSIYVVEGERIRRIDGLRGGNIYGFRKEYNVTPPLCPVGNCTYPFVTDIPIGTIFHDVVADSGGILDIESFGSPYALYRSTDDLSQPRELIAGGPEGDTQLTAPGDGEDDTSGQVILARRLEFGGEAEIVRAPDGAIYATDPTRNLVYRIARTVPPMYLSSWVPSEDGSEMFLFDDEGRHLETRDARTHDLIWSFVYDVDGRLEQIVDRFEDATIIHRTGGVATSIESPDHQFTTLGHTNGFLSSVIDPSLGTKGFSYSSTGLLEDAYDSNSYSEFHFDPRGRLTGDDASITYLGVGEGLAEQQINRTASTPTLVEVTHTSAEGVDTRYQHERTGPSSTARRVTWPDASINTSTHTPSVDSVTYADGTKVTTRFGVDLRLGTNTRVPDQTEIEIPGLPTATTTFGRSFVPHCTSFTEDCDPLADPGMQADEVVDTMAMGGDPQWTETFARAHVSGGSPVPATTTLTSPLGRVTTTTLNDEGLVGSVAVPGIAPTTYGYDPRGRLSSVGRTDGVQPRLTVMTYDAQGFLETVTDSLARTTEYEYDPAGRITRQIFPDLRYVDFAYDVDGNLTSITPPSRPAHGFTYDSVDRNRSYDPPPLLPASTTTYAYNEAHQPDLITRPDAQTLDLIYGPVTGKLDEVVLSSGGSYVYTYDPVTGQPTSVVDPTLGELTYEYAGFLVTRETLSGLVAGNVSWGYDDQLRVETESVNNANTVTAVYDDDGSPSSIGALALATDPTNGLLIGTTVQGVTTTHDYNGFGEPELTTYVHGDADVYELDLQRDAVGRIHTKTEVRDGGLPQLRCYEYDDAGRLTDVYDGADAFGCTGSQVEHYGYDDNGNRNAVTNSAGTLVPAQIVTDVQDRLTQYGGVTYAYTANGEVSSRTEGGDTTTYVYDAMGNLQTVDLPNTANDIEYVYDARDRRVGKLVGGVLQQGLLYGDQISPAAELDGGGSLVWRFVYGTQPHVPDYMVDDVGDVFRVVTDQLGSVVMVVDATTGDVMQEITYDSWGRVLSETAAPGFDQPFRYAGGIQDEDTGWIHFGARDYRPDVGAWAAKDPMGFGAGDSNLYRYTPGDPVNFIDPTGLYSWWMFMNDANNVSAGIGDAMTAGVFLNWTGAIRERLDVSSGVVNPCGNAYLLGVGVGMAGSLVGPGLFRGLARNACFAAGTDVETEDGRRPIEEVEIGDLVWSRDEETGQEGWQPVTEVFVTPDSEILELTFEGGNGRQELLLVTPEHPLWSLDDGDWDEAGELELGEQVYARGGRVSLTSVSTREEGASVYNLEVAGAHTYFVGEAGIWAHNKCRGLWKMGVDGGMSPSWRPHLRDETGVMDSERGGPSAREGERACGQRAA